MSKTLTSGKAQAKLESLKSKIEELNAELPLAQAREELVIGNEYLIYQGRGDERKVVAATLVAQRVDADGVTKYAFQINETGEFAANVSSRVLAKDGSEEKVRSSDKIKSIIERLQSDVEATELALEEALARESLEVNQPYRIRVGRGKTAEVVTAVLLGIGTVEKVKKQIDAEGNETVTVQNVEALNFFYGAGFDARTVLVSRSAVVFASDEDTAEAAAETTAAEADVE